MSELDVQPRVNSDSISHAFEQNIKGDNELYNADRGSAGQANIISKHGAASRTGGVRPPSLRASRAGYTKDPLMAAEDDPEDSWLIPSPGPPSTRNTFDMSPRREEQGSRRRGGFARPTSASSQKSKAISQKQDENGFANGKKASPIKSPSKGASKIPRVAQLTTAKSKSGSFSDHTSPSPTTSQSSKSGWNSSSRVVAPKKKEVQANSTSQNRPDSWKTKSQNDWGKGSVSGRAAALDAKRDDKASSRIPSRPGSAASVNSVRTTASQRPGLKKSPTPPAVQPRVSSAASNGGVPAKRKSLPGSGPNSRRTSRAGGEAPSGRVQLLTAVSGTEEDLAKLVSPAPEPEPELAPEAHRISDTASQTPEAAGRGEQEILDAAQEETSDELPTKHNTGGQPPAQGPAISAIPGLALSKQGSAASSKADPINSARSAKNSKSTTPRPDWIDIVPPPENLSGESLADGVSSSQNGGEAGQQKLAVNGSSPKENSAPEEASEPPVEGSTVSVEAVADDKPVAEERPGVGRKKAADLPHKGYFAPEPQQKGCCGCVVM